MGEQNSLQRMCQLTLVHCFYPMNAAPVADEQETKKAVNLNAESLQSRHSVENLIGSDYSGVAVTPNCPDPFVLPLLLPWGATSPAVWDDELKLKLQE